jgi:sugar lactone lactonase YvrE
LTGRIKSYFLAIGAACLFAVPVAAHPGSGIAVDARGQVYFLDTGSGLWRINTRGAVTRLSPERNHWLAIDPTSGFASGRLPTDPARDWVITPVGSNPTVLISTDFPIAMGPDGSLYYKLPRTGHFDLIRSTPAGATSTFLPLPASIEQFNGIAATPDGSIYFTDNNTIRRIDARHRLTTVATVSPIVNGAHIPDVDQHPYLRGLAVDANGNMYVADSSYARVLKITPTGTVTTLVTTISPWAPTAVALSGSIVYVLEYLHTTPEDRLAWLPRVRKITPDGRSTIIATIDNMPGARPAAPAKVAGLGIKNLIHLEFLNPFNGKWKMEN